MCGQWHIGKRKTKLLGTTRASNRWTIRSKQVFGIRLHHLYPFMLATPFEVFLVEFLNVCLLSVTASWVPNAQRPIGWLYSERRTSILGRVPVTALHLVITVLWKATSTDSINRRGYGKRLSRWATNIWESTMRRMRKKSASIIPTTTSAIFASSPQTPYQSHRRQGPYHLVGPYRLQCPHRQRQWVRGAIRHCSGFPDCACGLMAIGGFWYIIH